uniref:Uncharacterized protein n=1 Tax=Lotharella oceanica TaxID=641309 RepID=A0A7S2TV15_9EUKA|mmetsp:Transcript_29526/g.55236  ORF Transcript_29526/g.55236 Transcript_29526/m.55236 type:complete len:201 (+) Transcript_29526:653-1255(+)
MQTCNLNLSYKQVFNSSDVQKVYFTMLSFTRTDDHVGIQVPMSQCQRCKVDVNRNSAGRVDFFAYHYESNRMTFGHRKSGLGINAIVCLPLPNSACGITISRTSTFNPTMSPTTPTPTTLNGGDDKNGLELEAETVAGVTAAVILAVIVVVQVCGLVWGCRKYHRYGSSMALAESLHRTQADWRCSDEGEFKGEEKESEV